MLANLAEIANSYATARRGLGAFNVIQLENARTFTRAAEATNCSVVLQISQNAVKYHDGMLAPIGLATLEVARQATVPVVVHLDHAEDPALCRAAIDLGFTSVMYDGSKLADAENRRVTASVVEYAHANGVSVEAELGEVGGKNGVHDPAARTDPADAARFVSDTGVDLLAVAVGSSHAMTSREAQLDFELISAIAAAVPVPLVLHGSSGVSDSGMQQAIAAGMTKINVSTHLNRVFTRKLRSFLAANPDVVDTRKWFWPAAAAQEVEVARLLQLYAMG